MTFGFEESWVTHRLFTVGTGVPVSKMMVPDGAMIHDQPTNGGQP